MIAAILIISVSATALALSACMLSSRISRDEESDLTDFLCAQLERDLGTGTEAPISSTTIRNEYERDCA